MRRRVSAVEQLSLSLDCSETTTVPGLPIDPARAMEPGSISAQPVGRNCAPRRSRQRVPSDYPESTSRALTAPIENQQPNLFEGCEQKALPEIAAAVAPGHGHQNAVDDPSPSMIASRRCFPLTSAFDCLNRAEVAMYRALLSMAGNGCDGDHASACVVAGYSDLKSSDVPDKTSVKRTIGRLLRKRYIERVEVGAGAQSQKTCYRVYAPDTVLAMLIGLGYRSWQQVGAGRQPVRVASVEVAHSNRRSSKRAREANDQGKTRRVR